MDRRLAAATSSSTPRRPGTRCGAGLSAGGGGADAAVTVAGGGEGVGGDFSFVVIFPWQQSLHPAPAMAQVPYRSPSALCRLGPRPSRRR